LVGVEDARDAYGARVALLLPGGELRWERVHTDGSYLSASEPTVTFALAAGMKDADIGVVWRNGRRELFRGLQTNRVSRIRQGDGEPWRP
jgi:hypothetical protein